ncbi:hypothetical protein ABK040_009309 [Willaertia magna]
MRLFPHIKTTPSWHLMKSVTILLVISSTLLYFIYFKNNIDNNYGNIKSSTKTFKKLLSIPSSDKSITFNNKSTTLIITSTTSNTISDSNDNGGDNDDSGGGDSDDDDDGNTKFCHQVANFKLDQCEFVNENCPNPMGGGVINYLWLRYCGLQSVPPIFFILGILWVLVLFYFLSSTAETYFCPGLVEISRILRLSPDVAGVTFLAFGNGAPDIASIIAGIFSGSTGFGVGEPIGAGVFVTTVIMSAVTLFSDAKVLTFPFLRDAIAYLIAVSYVMIIVFIGEITLWQSIICLGIYLLYVIFVISSRLIIVFYKRRKAKQQLEKKSLIKKKRKENYGTDNTTSINEREEDFFIEESDEEVNVGWKAELELEPNFNIPIDKLSDITDDLKKEIVKKQHSSYTGSIFMPKFGIVLETDKDLMKVTSEDKHHHHHHYNIQDEQEHSTLHRSPVVIEKTESALVLKENDFERTGSIIINQHFNEPTNELTSDNEMITEKQTFKEKIKDKFNEYLEWIEWNDKNILSKIFFICFEGITLLVRSLTIPKADPEEWSKFFAVLNPLFMPVFAVFSAGYIGYNLPNTNFPLWALLTLLGIPFSIIIYFTTTSRKPPRYHFVFVFLSFVMSVLWIYVIANEMVDFLTSLGVILRISDAILSITILAWGNSLGDLVADVVVARQGFVEMAMGGIFGGPLLNLLIGLGISTTASNIFSSKPYTFATDITVLSSFFFLLASLISSLVVVGLNQWRSPKIFGVFLLLLYASYLTLCILIETKVLFQKQ